MHDFRIYRDNPKPGETDAGWCAYATHNGHVTCYTTGHLTPEDAEIAAIRLEAQAYWPGGMTAPYAARIAEVEKRREARENGEKYGTEHRT